MKDMIKLRLKKLPGRVYRKYRKLSDGSRVYVESWTVRYKGKDHATGTTDEKEAENFLRKLIGGSEKAEHPWKANLKLTPVPATTSGPLITEILDLFIQDSRLRGLASATGNEGIVRNYLKPFFGKVPAGELTTTLLTAYKLQRLDAKPKPANGTINRELAALKRALNYAMDEHEPPLLRHFPKIVLLPEADPREGILEHRNYLSVRRAMPDYWEPVFVCAYHVGRRRGELTSIELSDVVMDAEQPYINVYPDTAKNGKPSKIPIYGDMVQTIRIQIRSTRQHYPDCKLLFHRNGKVIHKGGKFYDEWKEACTIAGVPHLRFHDLRRTACTMLIEAGCDEKEAMEITGHKTPSAFRRYHIVRSSRMTVTVNKAVAYMAGQQKRISQETRASIN